MKIGFVSTHFDQVPQEYQGSREAEEPLDVMYAISAARERGHVAALIDVWSSGLADRLAELDAVVFSTTNSYLQWNNHPLGLSLFENVWRRASSHFPARRPRTVVFGPHVPSHWSEIYALGADAVVLGEGELVVVEIAERLVAGAPAGPAPGLVDRDGSGLDHETAVEDLDSLPRPAWEDTVAGKYNAHNYPEGTAAGHLYEGSRGCPYFCVYCNTVTHRRRFRTKSPDKIHRELAWLSDISPRDYVYFIDESFAARDSWIQELAPRLKELPFRFGCQGNLKFMTRKKFDLLREAGFVSIEFGFETGDAELIRQVGKDNKLGEAADLINYAASIGLNPLLFTLVGLPGESVASLGNTVAFFRGLSPETRISVAMPTPYVATKLFKMGEGSGVIAPKSKGLSLYQYSGLVGHQLSVDLGVRTEFLRSYGPNNHLEPAFVDRFARDVGQLFGVDVRA